MSEATLDEKRNLLRALPAVDQLLRSPAVRRASEGLAPSLAARAVREGLQDVRTWLSATEVPGERVHPGPEPPRTGQDVRQRTEQEAVRRLHKLRQSLLGPVINATGVLLHTNLGRAPLSERALAAVQHVARGYSNLEYDVPTGRRGLRDLHGETLLTTLTGAEAALVVNNNAAAVLLVLSALARDREVILSRGEMIEIGGAFRIPEVMAQSGAILREVGTTNRTHLKDYEGALHEGTGAILKVHPSNYRVVGFTKEVDARDLAPLARRHGIPLVEDLGSGVLIPTDAYGLAAEPTVQSRIAAGIDVVTFSGDKLLGGPQAGIIVGRRDLVEACRRHPLARAFRVDKMTLAALQATLLDYLQGAHAQLPLYAMMAVSVETLRTRAHAIVQQLARVPGDGAEGEAATGSGRATTAGHGTVGGAQTKAAATAAAHGNVRWTVDVVDSRAAVGGGSLPGETLPSVAIALRSFGGTPDQLAARLRRHQPPVVGRVEGAEVLLDVRTVAPEEDGTLAAALQRLANDIGGPTL